MKVITSQHPAVTAADQLNEVLSAYAARPVLLMLSGGSALTILEHVDVSLLGPHVTITTLDERFSTDPTINNFAQIAATDFYKKAIEQAVHTISTVVESNETLPEAGKRFDAALHHWRESHRDGVVVVTMGVGSDGHTAGIFPGDHGVDFSSHKWVEAYEVPLSVNQYPSRITVTYTFLRSCVTEAVVFLTGKNKDNISAELKKPKIKASLPIKIIQELPKVRVVMGNK